MLISFKTKSSDSLRHFKSLTRIIFDFISNKKNRVGWHCAFTQLNVQCQPTTRLVKLFLTSYKFSTGGEIYKNEQSMQLRIYKKNHPMYHIYDCNLYIQWWVSALPIFLYICFFFSWDIIGLWHIQSTEWTHRWSTSTSITTLLFFPQVYNLDKRISSSTLQLVIIP